MSQSFADLGVPTRLVEALAADGITEPFPVQAITLPDALAGKDLCGRAPTGSGKTLGFGIPMMVRISQAEPTKPTGLVLVPTRELAEQVQRAFVPLGRAQWRFIQAIYGGASFGPQIHSLRKGASVVVATPGRLLDIIEKGYCDLSAVEVCVIDEADRMADLGFMPDVRKILDMTPPTRQTMLWSATLDGDVNELIRDYMNNPVRHDLMTEADTADVDHKFVVTRPSDRLDAAVALIEEHGPTIVFVKTRFGVDDVSEDLNRAGVTAGALHGARSQAVRQRTLEDFKRGKIQALVATDVAARGIHVDNVSLVLHYDLPDNDKDYTHRSGRTGRAGATGLVIAFVPPSRQRIAQRMSDAVEADVSWEQGEKPIERVPAGERETGNRDRGERTGYAGRGGSDGHRDRPNYGDRSDRGSSYGDRGSSFGDRGRDRGDRGDRPSYAANDRPQYDRPRSDRPSYDRDAAPRRDRPAYGADRPAAGGDRPAYGAPRSDRNDSAPRSDRTEWTPRPARDDAAPARDRNDWSPSAPRSGYTPRRDDDRSNQRGRTEWTPRPPRGDAAPARDRNDWSPRPPRGDSRPGNGPDTRGGYRGDRPAYGNDRNSARPGSDRPTSDRPSSDRPWADRSRSDRPQGDRPGYQGSNPRPASSRDGNTDRPWKSRDDSAAPASRPWADRDGRGASPRSGGSDRPGTTGGYKGSGFKSGGFKSGAGKPAGAKTNAARTGGFKSGGFRAAPGGSGRPRPSR